MIFGNLHRLRVLDDVGPFRKVVRLRYVFADLLGLDSLSVTDFFFLPTDSAGIALFVHGFQRQIDPVGLNLLVCGFRNVLCNERPTPEHTTLFSSPGKNRVESVRRLFRVGIRSAQVSKELPDESRIYHER
ncbi:hypothetical protein SAMN05421858_0092 [Haladaptatus litoreus]|uniref:Uncharacterized protein n=1 Tax=Haladaptatus litoreus TaxID=553468 RepID=A0A1N6UTK6_9EURY|nr:hypothetical protein SAMN05421858_0092 [Haladaptatus litoreus]